METRPSVSRDRSRALERRFEILRMLVAKNGETLQLLSDLQADLGHLPAADARIRRPVDRLLDEVLLMAEELNLLTGGQQASLYQVLERLREEIRGELRSHVDPRKRPVVVRLESEDALDPTLVGGKAAGVARLRRVIPEAVPDGFVITTAGYAVFLEENGIQDRIRLQLQDCDVMTNRQRLLMTVDALQTLVQSQPVPDRLCQAIMTQAERTSGRGSQGWAVRSSAIQEDGDFSFAGQYETLLGVSEQGLAGAYAQILASRFSERAIAYRMSCGLREVETPMAVLFMPLIDARTSGVVHTTVPHEPEAQRMVIHAAPGLGQPLMQGRVCTQTAVLSRTADPVLLDRGPASTAPTGDAQVEACVTPESLIRLGTLAFQLQAASGYDLEIEWALDGSDQLWVLQGRRLPQHRLEGPDRERSRRVTPCVEAGITIFPGRAEGRLVHYDPSRKVPYPRGAVLLVQHPSPEIAPLLPDLAALIAVQGSPVGHLAVLLREFNVPSLYGIGAAAQRLSEGGIVSVDATRREIHEGSRWPSIRDRVLARIGTARHKPQVGPLYARVLHLSLTDPFSAQFKASACRSVHDVIRYVHEMSVRSLFRFGDQHRASGGHRARILKSDLPMRFRVLELGGEERDHKTPVRPEELKSQPFQAFWRGFADPGLAWPQRWNRELAGFPGYFREQVFGGLSGIRREGDPNYLIIGGDYLNLNARFAFHYAMVDAYVGIGRESNYVHLRFHSGGASGERQHRRAKFMERVLRQSSFGVDCHGHLLTAWFRRYNGQDSERALETLGRLMVCARQLDLLMSSEEDVKRFAEAFLAGRYGAFA